MSWWKVLLGVIAMLVLAGIGFAYYSLEVAEGDIYVPMFAMHCGECHGNDLAGTERGVALVDNFLEGGDTVAALVQSIKRGKPESGMPAFDQVLSEELIKGLAIYVGERRMGQSFMNFRFRDDMVIPEEPLQSQAHDFYIETFAQDLDQMPFSIAPMPDGSFLLTEKERGLSIISADGVQSEPIEGTPKTGITFDYRGVKLGIGWLLDVAPHPNFEENGWIYLHYTELCKEECEELGMNTFIPISMNRLDRGRIKEGKWVDVENIWRAQPQHYTPMPDTGAGGRIAFDDAGHVFISIGMKGTEINQDSPQFLDNPYGKIHRVNDDGTIPADNPFVVSDKVGPDAPFHVQSIWTYGHRSPQGLEWNPVQRTVWEAEMGPRGGDEVNELLPGKNYGWPYHSLGLEYTGSYVARHENRDIEFDPESVEGTLVDFTPSPAISSFAFYHGDQFPAWQNNVLLGSLKGTSLFRIAFDGKRLIEQETLIKGLARIRDVEIGYDGLVYLLLESRGGSRIVRLVPAE